MGQLFTKAVRIIKIHGIMGFLEYLYLFIDRYVVLRKLKYLETHCYKTKFSGRRGDGETKILFFSGCDSEAVRRYRVTNVVDILNLDKQKAIILSSKKIKDTIGHLHNFKVVVFSRLGMSEINRRLISIMQRFGIICVFEIDDYLFDEKMSPYIDAIGQSDRSTQRQYLNLIKNYRGMMLACGHFITSTNFLADRGKEMNRKTHIIRAGLNDQQIAIAQTILKEVRIKGPKIVTLGYFSGSYTHNADFKTIVSILKQILQKYEHVNLNLCGCISIPLGLQEFKHRIKLVSFVRWEKLPYNIAKVDINLVPLEYNNPFCNGKSEIKYLEAGILAIPTIATATDTYRCVIKQGENGFIACDEKEWEKYLMLLIENRKLREEMGLNARQHILEKYTPATQKDQIKRVFENILNDRATK